MPQIGTTAVDQFAGRLPETIENLITQHHTIYRSIPPQGIFFELLAERAFDLSGARDVRIYKTSPNQPQPDLLVGRDRIQIKTETGKSTKKALITITKLCTTEKEPWTPKALVQHVMNHLGRYDRMLMLRAMWPEEQRWIHYQLLEIPVSLLRLIGGAKLTKVGKRRGRRSLGADIAENGKTIFHVHFDGADGKCQVTRLLVSRCRMLREWDQRIE